MMGCFTVSKSKKKKSEQIVHVKCVLPQEGTPTTLPEPQIHTHALQSAPSSFRTRIKPVQPTNKVVNNRARALSAPSSFHGTEHDKLPAVDDGEREESKCHVVLPQEQKSPSPQPLPLPSPQCYGALKSGGSFKSGHSSGPLFASGPLPLPPSGTLRNFSHEEIASACHNFSSDNCTSESLSSTTYKASFCDVSCSLKKIGATITRFYPSTQVILQSFVVASYHMPMLHGNRDKYSNKDRDGDEKQPFSRNLKGIKEFLNEINMLASLQHPNLCKLLGYHSRDSSEQRILVYERLQQGSLDRLLYGRSDGGVPIDWSARVKVALCAAQGLTFFHEEGPFQAMYNEFSAVNIQIDKDFSAKLSGYGCVGLLPEADLSDTSPVIGNLSVETVEKGLLTPKSNVYSFGIVLLELLTGRKNMGSRQPKEERNLVKWSWPFLADDCRLSLIMDPQLKGQFPIKAARTVADIAQRCLRKDPSERPTMRTVVEHLKTVQDMKHSCRFPLPELASVARKQMFRSPSLPPRHSSSQSSPSRLLTLPLSIPPRACSSLLALDELDWQESRRSSLSMV